MLEWDLAAYRRKYEESLCVMSVKGTLQSVFVEGISEDGGIIFHVILSNKEKTNLLVSEDVYPEYFPIRSRYYKEHGKNKWVHLKRKHSSNCFLIGAAVSNFFFTSMRGDIHKENIDLLSRETVPFGEALRLGGPLSPHMFINFMGEIFFRDEQIALLDKASSVITLEKSLDFYYQEVLDHFPGYTIK